MSYYCPQTRRLPSWKVPWVSSMTASASAASLHTKLTQIRVAISTGTWNAWETEPPFHLKKRGLKQGARWSGSMGPTTTNTSNLKCSGLRVLEKEQLDWGWSSSVGGRASAITKAIHHYWGRPPLLRQSAITEADSGYWDSSNCASVNQTTQRLKIKGWRKIYQANGEQKEKQELQFSSLIK